MKVESVAQAAANQRPTGMARVVQGILIAIAIGFLALFVVLPVINVFQQAMSKGVSAYVANFVAPPPIVASETLSRPEKLARLRAIQNVRLNWQSIRLTIGIAAIAVPLNVLFGVAAAWAIAKFRFKGRALLTSLIDLPFSVSPVVAGLMIVLIFGRQGLLGKWAPQFVWAFPSPVWRGFSAGDSWPISISLWHYRGVVFTPLAMVIATVFITFPFVARTLIPLMESQGTDDELAALTLGAGGFQMFRRVTLPNIRWGVLYGIILCNARAMGEFGAVSVVAGNLQSNNTIPLRVENIWMSGNTPNAFALASVLTLLAVITLILKTLVELRVDRASGVR